ncbi:MAG: VOC family protein [Gammaproteobacteria bacterium]
MRSYIDHLVVGAASLEAGARYIEEALGVAVTPGGEHSRMGTHNRLLALGDSIYLEVIAVNPAAPPPGRPRWFGLDDPGVQSALVQSPRLLTWVARTESLDAERLPAYLGTSAIETMARGELEWSITLPPDGALCAGGLLPLLLQWRCATHPVAALPGQGCRLLRLELHHLDPVWLKRALEPISWPHSTTICQPPAGGKPCLAAVIETPRGLRTLRSLVS